MGFVTHMIVVEAENESDAIDALTDSNYGHLIKVAPEDVLSDDWQTYAGNYDEPVNLDEVRILARCKVNYFAKKDKN